MNDILQANIFFFITSVSVVLVTIMMLAIGWYIFKLSRSLHRLAEKIEKEANGYIEDSKDLREKVFEHPVVEMLLGKKKHTRTSKRDL